MTIAEVDESLATEVKRHAVLKSIIEKIEELQKVDPEGAEWILEKLSE